MKKQNNKGAKNILKDVVADCFNKSVIIAKNIWEAPMGIDIAIKRDFFSVNSISAVFLSFFILLFIILCYNGHKY